MAPIGDGDGGDGGDGGDAVTRAAHAAELLNSNLKNYAGVRLRALAP